MWCDTAQDGVLSSGEQHWALQKPSALRGACAQLLLCSISPMQHRYGPRCLRRVCHGGAKHRIPGPPHPPSAPDVGKDAQL